jgi:hypothetical protein
MRLRPFKPDFFRAPRTQGVSTPKIRPTATGGDPEETHLQLLPRNFFPTSKAKPVATLKIGPTGGSLRSDGRQGSSPLGGAPLVPRSASLTASSLRLWSFYGELALPSSNQQSVGDCQEGGKLVET